MVRTFKEFTITAGGTPQPLVGTYISAAGNPIGPDFQGEQITTLTIGDSSMILQGDYVLLQSVTYTNKELVRVQKVTNGTTIVVRGSTLARVGGAFGTGDFVSLAIPVSTAYVQSIPGNSGLLYIGTVGMNKTGLVKVIKTLQFVSAGTQPSDFSDARYYTADALGAADYWIDGSTGDGYLPSFGVA